jgi:copper homeostasis protein CutC
VVREFGDCNGFGHLQITFHRAFDELKGDFAQALKDIIELGCERY